MNTKIVFLQRREYREEPKGLLEESNILLLKLLSHICDRMIRDPDFLIAETLEDKSKLVDTHTQTNTKTWA